MAASSNIAWTEATTRFGPRRIARRDGDKRQARSRINHDVRLGLRSAPNDLPCVDCGHVWSPGERRHEYDHYLGYAAEHHYDIEAVCSKCHHAREVKRALRTHCRRGHVFTTANTVTDADGGRRCRMCRDEADRKRHDAAYWRAYRAARREMSGG